MARHLLGGAGIAAARSQAVSISSIGGAAAYPGGGFRGFGVTARNAPRADRTEFDLWARMSPAQRLRANLLASMGVTEEQLKAMRVRDRERIEAMIEQRVEQQMKRDAEAKKLGLKVDITV